MKVKHWAGYGCVEARCTLKHKVRTSGIAKIEVTGNHECGLLPRYFGHRDWERWLGKRFHLDHICDVEAEEYWFDKDHQDHMIVTFYTDTEV